eukprot:8722770-Pyramimonas_sp.AAC.1
MAAPPAAGSEIDTEIDDRQLAPRHPTGRTNMRHLDSVSRARSRPPPARPRGSERDCAQLADTA